MTQEFIKTMYQNALKARENSYSPYSKFKVGACVSLKDGEFVFGTNIENASYGLTICAERNALFATYAKGYRKQDIKCLAIICECEKGKYCSPCGACRQVISELLEEDTPILLFNLDGEYMETNIKDLLPYSFNSEDII